MDLVPLLVDTMQPMASVEVPLKMMIDWTIQRHPTFKTLVAPEDVAQLHNLCAEFKAAMAPISGIVRRLYELLGKQSDVFKTPIPSDLRYQIGTPAPRPPQ